jgi:hypothetical protein
LYFEPILHLRTGSHSEPMSQTVANISYISHSGTAASAPISGFDVREAAGVLRLRRRSLFPLERLILDSILLVGLLIIGLE